MLSRLNQKKYFFPGGRVAFILFMLATASILSIDAKAQAHFSNTEKPWTYWWWMGSAVDVENIKYQIDSFAKSGFGGVHIIPIYGVKGEERNFIPFLSTTWMTMLQFTIDEAKKRGLEVDMSMGTGWPFGGRVISPEYAAKKFTIVSGKFESTSTGQRVKRAAPGGEGLVVDHFDSLSVTRYLAYFDKPLATVRTRLRSLYNDSYEVYGANWTNDFLEAFKQKRGYDLQKRIDDFRDTTNTQAGILVRMDYHQTLSELLHDRFAATWTQWSHERSFLTRYQAHGSPGNLIDLYALADIPETESFGTSAFPIPGLRVDDHYEKDRFGTPDPLAMKFASSAANLTGKTLVSSETGTWLGDHFKVSLSQVKPQVDELFTSGINHIFYHGITYSPKEAGFPGWLFYASTNFGLQSHLWKHIGVLNQYIERCQHLLQRSTPDNDVLVYFPVHDLWATPTPKPGDVHLLDVHHTERWLRGSAFGKLSNQLLEGGITFDYVSDSLLSNVKVEANKRLTIGTAHYKVLVVPPVEYLPERTLIMLNKLAGAGANILFQDHLPEKPAGYRSSKSFAISRDTLSRFGNVSVSSRILNDLTKYQVIAEGFSVHGLRFIRKREPGGNLFYFVSNLNNKFSRGWIRITSMGGIDKYDPITKRAVNLPVRKNKEGQTEIFLDLLPGESCFLFTGNEVSTKFPSITSSSHTLSGTWNIKFTDGLPKISDTFTTDRLRSWTNLSDSATFFYGTVTYRLSFAVPDHVRTSQDATLDLGDVREVAEVTLNGKSLGVAWCIPYQLTIPGGVLQKENTIEIKVSNLSSNYMRLYDKLRPGWKKFYDINIVDIQYKPFDATRLGVMPSGLMGDIRIRY